MSHRKIGTVLRELRYQNGLTQDELARKANVARSYVARLEAESKMNPSIAVLKRLAKALNVPVTELLE